MAISPGDNPIGLMGKIKHLGVFALPGHILTLGGALTSSNEWFWG
ncbi:MAG: hypothetical protein O4859_25540 [Trichodesmium sp. St18_bin1]|nr:hypothetical protein [Trichodesmium sp. St18_bin1]